MRRKAPWSTLSLDCQSKPKANQEAQQCQKTTQIVYHTPDGIASTWCSSEIAYSYLDHRIDPKEVFIPVTTDKGNRGDRLTFSELIVRDKTVRSILVHSNINSQNLFPKQKKNGGCLDRWRLFTEIVLWGDDSLAPLFLEIDKKEKIIKQLKINNYKTSNDSKKQSEEEHRRECKKLEQVNFQLVEDYKDIFCTLQKCISIIEKKENHELPFGKDNVCSTLLEKMKKLIDSLTGMEQCNEKLENKLDLTYSLGLCYEKGIGIPKNMEEAVKCYRKAAELGHAEAQYKLGECYQYGTR